MAASLQLLEEYFVTLNVEDDEYEYESCAPSLRRQDSGKRRRLNQPQAPFTPLRRSSLDNSLRQCQQRSKSLEHFYGEVFSSNQQQKQRRRASLDSTIHHLKKHQHQPSLFVDKNATWNDDDTLNNSNRSIITSTTSFGGSSPARSSSKNIVDPFDTSSRFRGILQDSMYTTSSSESCSRSTIKKEGGAGGSS